ncbi:gTPase, IMAP member 8 [Branchiostoma belcheri]|nr:gTPase, IMAP member 8 [Branchiostoma belcheri]
MPHDKIIEEISRVHVLAHSGIHAIILVFRPDCKLTEEERRAYDSLIQKFQPDILKHVIILYTRGDECEEDELKDLISNDKNPKWFKKLLKQVNNRYLIFDNRTDDQDKQESQRHRLLQMILDVMADNNNRPYSNKYTKIVTTMYEVAQRVKEQDRKQKVTPGSTNQTAGAAPKTPKANPKKTRCGKKLVPSWTQRLSTKNNRRGKQQQKKKMTANIPSLDVIGKSTVPGRDDDEPTSQWTVCKPRSGKTNKPKAVQTQVPSSSYFTQESPSQNPNTGSRLPSEGVVGAAIDDKSTGQLTVRKPHPKKRQPFLLTMCNSQSKDRPKAVQKQGSTGPSSITSTQQPSGQIPKDVATCMPSEGVLSAAIDDKSTGQLTVCRPRLNTNYSPNAVQKQGPSSRMSIQQPSDQIPKDVATCVPSEGVRKAVVDDKSTGQQTARNPQTKDRPKAVQKQGPSLRPSTQQPPDPIPKDVTTCVPSEGELGAGVVEPRVVRKQTQPTSQIRRRRRVKPGPTTIEIHERIEEMKTWYKEREEREKKIILQALKDEMNKDTKLDCFPAFSVLATVSVDGVTELPFYSVSVDDEVRASADTFEPIFIFSHALEDVLSTFIEVTTEKGKAVSLSQSHLITIIKDGERVTVPAREVKKGDKVFSVDESSGCLTPDKVVNVHNVLKSGQYCPHTYSGSLIVDGVFVSCYTDKLPLRLAHGLLLPLGWLHRACPRLFRLLCAPGETGGVPWWMGKLDDMLTWWRSR